MCGGPGSADTCFAVSRRPTASSAGRRNTLIVEVFMSKWQQIQAERQALFWELVRQGTVLIHHRPSPLRSMPSHYRRATLDHGQCDILPGSGYGRDVGLTAAVDRLGDRAVDERGHDGHLDQPTTRGEEVL